MLTTGFGSWFEISVHKVDKVCNHTSYSEDDAHIFCLSNTTISNNIHENPHM